jgi:hypothetical protein
VLSRPADHVALINHPIVLMPLAGEIKSGLGKCAPRWKTWVPWKHKDHSMDVHSTNESIMRFETQYLGNLGELEQMIGSGQVAELIVYSNRLDSSPVFHTLNDLKIKTFIAQVAEVSIKPENKALVVSNLESIFKLVGQDQHGRQFNTLHGGKVTWSFDHSLIERIPMANSTHRFEYLFRENEDILVVRPREEGQLSLTATMECTGLTGTITMELIRPIRFEPEIIRINPGETVRATLFKGVERNGAVEIDAGLKVTRQNSPEITWEASVSEAAVFSANTLEITGIKKGMITITATHARFPVECNARLTVIVGSSSRDEKLE